MAHVLLIESDTVLASNICKALGTAGFDSSWAVEPQQAITLADTNLPDVVITDLVLAGRSGVEFMYEFASYPDWQNVPIILLSSVPENEINTGGHGFAELNIKKFIYKPHMSLSRLVEAVEYCLKMASVK